MNEPATNESFGISDLKITWCDYGDCKEDISIIEELNGNPIKDW